MLKQRQLRASLMRARRTLWHVLGQGRYDLTYDLMPVSIRGMSVAKRWNLLLAGTHLVRRSARAPNLPLHMHFELTSYCNLHCPVCPTGLGVLGRAPRTMDVALYERVMREVGPTLLTMSLWGWGESLLHPELREFLRIASRYPVATLISTNGQNLNQEEVVQALLDYPPAYLIVALDGLTDETHAVFRRGAQLAPALEGVRCLRELRIQRVQDRPILHMRCIIMKHNEHEVPHAPEFARAHGFDLLTLRTLAICNVPEDDHRRLLPESDAFRPYDYRDGARETRDDYVCTEPYWFPALLADGTLTACIHDSRADRPLGLISGDNGLRAAWFSTEADRVRRSLRAERAGFCVQCPYADRRSEEPSVAAHWLNSGARTCIIRPSPRSHASGDRSCSHP